MAASISASDFTVSLLVSARLQRARAEHGLALPWPTLASEQLEIAAQELHAQALGQGNTPDEDGPTEVRLDLLKRATAYERQAVEARRQELLESQGAEELPRAA